MKVLKCMKQESCFYKVENQDMKVLNCMKRKFCVYKVENRRMKRLKCMKQQLSLFYISQNISMKVLKCMKAKSITNQQYPHQIIKILAIPFDPSKIKPSIIFSTLSTFSTSILNVYRNQPINRHKSALLPQDWPDFYQKQQNSPNLLARTLQNRQKSANFQHFQHFHAGTKIAP